MHVKRTNSFGYLLYELQIKRKKMKGISKYWEIVLFCGNALGWNDYDNVLVPITLNGGTRNLLDILLKSSKCFKFPQIYRLVS